MHDLFLQNFFKAFVAVDPISLIPIISVITQGLNTKKTIKLSFFVFIITSFVLIFFSLYAVIFFYILWESLLVHFKLWVDFLFNYLIRDGL